MWAFLLVGVAVADPYGDAWARSADLEVAGDVAGALDALVPWRAVYPQDYALALQVAWLAYRLERFPEAESAYRAAVALSGGAPDALLGLAWTQLALGEPTAARSTLSELDPGHPGVAEALAAAPGGPAISVGVGTGFTAMPPDRSPSAAIEVRASARAEGRSAAGGATVAVTGYTGAGVAPEGLDTLPARGAPTWAGLGPGPGGPDGGGNPAPGPSGGPWSSTDPTAGTDLAFWGHGGAGGDALGAEAVAALLLQTAPDVAPGGVVGGIARWSPVGDLRLEASLTRPRGGAPDALRLAPSWWLPIGPVALEPAAALQLVAASLLPSAGVTAWVPAEGWAVWAGGRVGPQRTATSLALRATAAWPDLDRAGAWAGVRGGRLGSTWASAAWSAAWLDPDDGGPELPRAAHTVTATLSSTF